MTDVTNALPTLHTQTHVYLDPSPAILNTHSSILPHPFHLFSRFSFPSPTSPPTCSFHPRTSSLLVPRAFLPCTSPRVGPSSDSPSWPPLSYLLPPPSFLLPPLSSYLPPISSLRHLSSLTLGLLPPTFYLPPRICFRRFLPTCLLPRPSAISPPS